MKPTITLCIAASLLCMSALFINQPFTPQFKPRPTSPAHPTEPYFMKWAQTDLSIGEINPHARNRAFEQLLHRSSRAGDLGLTFVQRGPDNVGGRTRAILELYGKPDKLLTGSASGGLYISLDGGSHWSPHTQFQNLDSSSSIISSIYQDTVTGRIYVGTGCSFDAFDVSWPGFGIYVSDDEGATFRHLSSTTPDNRFSQNSDAWIAVNRIAVSRSGRIYAATDKGLRVSEDNGQSWINPLYLNATMTSPNLNVAADVAVTSNGRVIAGMADGTVYISETGEDKTFYQVNQSGGLPTSASRTCVAVSPSNEEVMYIMFIEPKMIGSNPNPNANKLLGIYISENGGETWKLFLREFDNFTPMSSSSTHHQGMYDAALAVSPADPNTIFIGGVQLWRYDGNLTRIASEFGDPPFQDVLLNYVHADKHYIYFSPNDNNRMYVTSDGGIAVSTNRGNTWQGLNKGYNSTQFYGIAFDNTQGIVLGGTQDNGTLVVLNDNENDPQVGLSLYGGDGYDCEVSQYSGIYFVSSQRGAIGRGERNLPTATLSEASNQSPFATVLRLWESINDPGSKDSIEFRADPVELSIGTSKGIIRNYSQTVKPLQPAAQVIKSSLEVYSGEQTLVIAGDLSTLTGNGTGSVDFNPDGSIAVEVTFAEAPAENADIYVRFDVRYDANAILYIESNNLKSNLGSHVFEHRLEHSMEPGEVLKVQDPVQSLLATNAGGGFQLYRNVLNVQNIPEKAAISGISGEVTCIEFTSDGSAAFAGTSLGRLYRITGLDDFYSPEDASDVLADQILNVNGGITGLAIDPFDDNRLIVTGGGYNSPDRVRLTVNAMEPVPTFTNVHGDLPPMPVYDAEIDRNNPQLVILGTEFGLWATANIEAPGVSWSDENDELSYVPVYDVRQQRLPWDQARNTGMYYIGTHGRGLWESASLTGTPEPDQTDAAGQFTGVHIFPNPVCSQAYLEFNAIGAGTVSIGIYDIHGRQVRSWQERMVNGTNRVAIDAASLRQGYYFARLENESQRFVSKFIVVK